MNTSIFIRATLLPLALGLALSVIGCRGDREDRPPRQFFPDMDDGPKWKPQSKSEFFADGRTMRPVVPGTVAFSRVSLDATAWTQDWAREYEQQRRDLLKEDAGRYQGLGADGAFLARIPIPVDSALLMEGQKTFNIYCAVCHGYTGDGKGMVGNSDSSWGWSYPLPTFHDPKYKNPAERTGLDGYLFSVSRVGVIDAQGVQKMPGYAHALSEYQSWAVVAYIRALQESRAGSPSDLSEQDREKLRTMTIPAAAAPATPASTPGTPAATPAGTTPGGTP